MNKIVFLMLSSIAVTGCKKEQEIKITEPPKEIITNVVSKIEGQLSQYCVAKSEKIKIVFTKDSTELLPGINYEIPIKIIFTEPIDIKAGRGYNDYGPKMELEFLDKEGKKIEGYYAGMKNSYTDLASLVKAGGKEEWLNFNGKYIVNSLDEGKSLEESKSFIANISRVVSIRIKSEIIEEKIDPNPNETIQETANRISGKNSKKSTNESSCDEFLDKYEEIVLEYVEIVKKVKNNPKDLTSMKDMAQISEKLGGLKGDISQCENDAKVAKRLVELQLKMANAAN
jgi:hypothetical protein